jgi:hypothetical protein
LRSFFIIEQYTPDAAAELPRQIAHADILRRPYLYQHEGIPDRARLNAAVLL